MAYHAVLVGKRGQLPPPTATTLLKLRLIAWYALDAPAVAEYPSYLEHPFLANKGRGVLAW